MNEKLVLDVEKKRTGMLCVIAVFAVLFGTLWPFNPYPANNVQWVSEANGVRVGRGGVILSQTDLQPARNSGGTQGVTLELLVRPASVDGGGTILGFYDAGNPQKLMVRQWSEWLLVTHDWLDERGHVKTVEFDVDHTFHAGRIVLLTITVGPNGAILYRNGGQGQLSRRFVITPSDAAGQIVLGTSPVDWRPWRGEVSGLAIYSRELTPAEVARHYAEWTAVPRSAAADRDSALARYLFDERQGRVVHSNPSSAPDLTIPRSFDVPHKGMLTSPLKEYEPTRMYANDVIINVLGFMPLGAILCVYFSIQGSRRQAILRATLIGGVLSFTIEVLQAYIPSRGSGITDIITNTIGALLGAAVVPTDLIRMALRAVGLVPAADESWSGEQLGSS